MHRHQKRRRLRQHTGTPYERNTTDHNQQQEQRQIQTTGPSHRDSNRSLVIDLRPQHQRRTPFRSPTGSLYQRSQLHPTWINTRSIGPGISNPYNNCFMNSVLECLTYTPSLAQYFLYHGHSNQCTLNKFCAMCAMERHLVYSLSAPSSYKKGGYIMPWIFLMNLGALSPTFQLGNQEDAHEYMMFLLASMHQSTVEGYGVLDINVERTALIYQIFGGQLRSQLRCRSCNAKSDTFENLLDLSVELQDAETVHEALENFTKVDRIGGDDPDEKYQCESCKQKVDAEKQLTIQELPSCLCIHLKRFTFDMQHDSMVKVTKYIQYSKTLDMAPFVSEEVHSPSAIYNIYAVLVHLGPECHRGHYFAYVKAPDGNWFRMDDDVVTPASLEEVLSQKAYILFYGKPNQRTPRDITKKKAANPDVLPEQSTGETATTSEQLLQTINSEQLSQAVISDELSPTVTSEQLSLTANSPTTISEQLSLAAGPYELSPVVTSEHLSQAANSSAITSEQFSLAADPYELSPTIISEQLAQAANLSAITSEQLSLAANPYELSPTIIPEQVLMAANSSPITSEQRLPATNLDELSSMILSEQLLHAIAAAAASGMTPFDESMTMMETKVPTCQVDTTTTNENADSQQLMATPNEDEQQGDNIGNQFSAWKVEPASESMFSFCGYMTPPTFASDTSIWNIQHLDQLNGEHLEINGSSDDDSTGTQD